MSLTSQLNDKESPLARFMASELPNTAAVANAYRARFPAGWEVKVWPQPPEGVKPAWGTLAAAIDHRLRYSLSADEPDGAVALGVRLTTGQLRQAGEDFLAHAKDLVSKYRPFERDRPARLEPPEAETALDRACYVAALFEEVYRSGRVWPGTPLATAQSLHDLLAAVPEYAVADITAIVDLSESGLRTVRQETKPEDVLLGPTFSGSPFVGGADADWVAGGLLGDVKATTTPSKLAARDIWQLIGYALLDFEDRYSIRRLGWYLARGGALITWEVDEFVSMLGGRPGVPDLRETLMERLLTHGPDYSRHARR